MHRCGLIALCVALVLPVSFTACSHTVPGENSMGPHETVRISAGAARIDACALGTKVKTALEVFYRDHGHLPGSIRELHPSYLTGYLMTSACEDGSTSEQTLIAYRTTGPGNCTVAVRDYIQGGGLLSVQKIQCRNGQFSDGGTITSNVAPRLP